MNRSHVHGGIPTLEVALSEYMSAGELKKLAALTGEKLPTRKADLAAVIIRHLDGERLREVGYILAIGRDDPVKNHSFALATDFSPGQRRSCRSSSTHPRVSTDAWKASAQGDARIGGTLRD